MVTLRTDASVRSKSTSRKTEPHSGGCWWLMNLLRLCCNGEAEGPQNSSLNELEVQRAIFKQVAAN